MATDERHHHTANCLCANRRPRSDSLHAAGGRELCHTAGRGAAGTGTRALSLTFSMTT